MPPSIEAAEAYISLLPITSPLAALRTKYGSPLAEVLRSKRASSAAFFCTDAMPFSASALTLYMPLERITSPFPAFKLKWNCPFVAFFNSAFRQQSPIYLGDIADVREGMVDRTSLITGNGQPAAVVSVARQIQGNILSIAQGVEQALRDNAASLPPALRITKVYDLAAFVAEAVRSVGEAIVIGGLLAIFVLLAFLRDWRATFVAATMLPLTIVGTFFALRLTGGTINLMSMGGLAVAIGLVVDDAIVVVENIHRHLAAGEPPDAAVERGTNELVAAVVGSTLTTVVVFIPLGLLQGMVGQFFAALSQTLSAAVLLSLVYALLFIPIPALRLLRPHAGERRETGWLGRRYEAVLRAALDWPALVVAVTLAVAVAGGLLYFRLETGFLPEMDEGGYVIDYWTPPGTSLPESDRMVKRIENVLAKTPRSPASRGGRAPRWACSQRSRTAATSSCGSNLGASGRRAPRI